MHVIPFDERARAALPHVKAPAQGPVDEPIFSVPAFDPLRVELGYGLLSLINDTEGTRIADRFKALRRQLASEMGFIMPPVRIVDNMDLPANAYVIRTKGIEAGQGELFPGRILLMDPKGATVDLPGKHTHEPVFGLAAVWADLNLHDDAAARGYSIADCAAVLTTHLAEILKTHMPDLLSYAQTKKLLDGLPAEHRELAEELIPSQIAVTGVQRVLRNLLAERVCIRDLPAILEGISEALGRTRDTTLITEHVRTGLSRQLCHQYVSAEGHLPVIALSRGWEDMFHAALANAQDACRIAIAPDQLQAFTQSVQVRFDAAVQDGETPALLTCARLRPHVRFLIERCRAQTPVLSQNEIHPSVRLRTLGRI